MKQVSPDASWRDSARPSKFFIINSSAAFPIVVLLFHITWGMFFICLAFVLFLVIIDYYGFTIPVFARFIRSRLAGRRREAVPWWV